MMKKIHVKLILIFILIFMFGNTASYFIATMSAEQNLTGKISDMMLDLVAGAQAVNESGNVKAEDIERLNTSEFLTLSFYKDLEMVKQLYQPVEGWPAEMPAKPVILQVKHLTGHREGVRMCIVKAGDAYIVAVPGLKSILFDFRAIILRANWLSILFGSLIMTVTAGFLTRALKKLQKATARIAKGDFNVHIDERRNDEIGELITNFNLMAKELNGMEMLRNNFVSDMSHEFKTPLTSIEGYANLLRTCETEEERNEYVRIITEETRRLSTLSSNILLLNRVENENITIVKHPYRLDEQIRHVILHHENKWTGKNIDLRVEMDEIVYEGSETLLYQVWLNLFDNAVKFSKEGGIIEVGLRKMEGKAVFTLTDFGKGMTEEEQKRMFEKFYTGDRSRATEGNGLGLSIVKRIVDMHDGRIEVASREGEFTTLRLTL